jgi:hypothetical protein
MAVSNPHRLVFLALLLIVAAAKLPTLSTPYFWDEIGWIGRAHRLSAAPLWHALPGIGSAEFGSRPPGLYLPVAALFKVVEPSIPLAHAIIVGFALLGVYFTYRLGELLYGATAGIIAALLLFCNAIYFAQAGMFHPDLPVAACGVASVYAMLRGEYGRYLFWALWLVLMKETGLALVVAISAYAFLIEWRHGVAAALGAALRWSPPLLVMGLYYALQRLTTGRFFMDFAQLGEPAGFFLPHLAMAQFRPVTRWLFSEQLRWIISALIVANLAVNRAARRRPELLLFSLIAIGSGYAFCGLYFLPRYLLPVAPYLFVLGAGALVELFPERVVHLPLAAALLAVMIVRLPGSERPGNREWDMGYLQAVRTYQDAAAYLDAHHRGRRIATTWPLEAYLRGPELGYVARPLDVVRARDAAALNGGEPVDVIAATTLSADRDASLAAYARSQLWPLAQRIENGAFRCDIYSAPAR